MNSTLTLYYSIAGTSFNYLATRILSVVLLSFLSVSALAATYTTVQDGAWSDPNTWDCTCVPALNSSHTIDVYHNVTYAGNFTLAGTTSLIVRPGADLAISGTFQNQWSNSSMSIRNGGAISATSFQFVGNSNPTYNINGSMTATTGDIFLNGSRTLNFSSTSVVTAAGDILVGTTSSSTTHTFSGTFNAVNFDHYQGSQITGDMTLNLSGDLNLYGNALFYPTTINATIGGNMEIDQSVKVDIGPGTINIGGDYNSIGGASITIDADINVTGNWLLGNGPTAYFNGEIHIDGYFDKFGGAKMYINNDMIVDGSMTVRSGTNNDDIYIAADAYVSAASLDVSGNSEIELHGVLDISSGNIDARGSGKIQGTGVVGWSTYTTDGSGYIQCTDGSQWDNYVDSPDPKPYPPANPLDLTTCDEGVLPVELVRFSGEASGNTVTLFWSTATEENSLSFIIERSSDGNSFEVAGEVAAAGYSQSLLNYSLTDAGLPGTGGGFYYRLLITDRDGASVHSKTIYVKAERKGLTLYPNPGNGNFLNIGNFDSATASISVSDMTGKPVYRGSLDPSGEGISIRFPKKLPVGMYILIIRTDSEIFEEKFIVAF